MVTNCKLSAADFDQIERLTKRVSIWLGADIITRSVMVRALLLKGLDLAKTREITGSHLDHGEPLRPVSFRLAAGAVARVDELLTRIQQERPNSGATFRNIQRPILLMALAEVQTGFPFADFCKTVRCSLPPRSTRKRSAPGRLPQQNRLDLRVRKGGVDGC
jgi:hypothetical protein